MVVVLLEIEIVKFQAQFCFAANIHFQVDMLEIRFDSPCRKAHVKSYLVIFIALTG